MKIHREKSNRVFNYFLTRIYSNHIVNLVIFSQFAKFFSVFLSVFILVVQIRIAFSADLNGKVSNIPTYVYSEKEITETEKKNPPIAMNKHFGIVNPIRNL